jgi:uncharacterized membrane protein (TIGR02234 family)
LYAIALLLEVVGAGGALLLSTRTWQTITIDRERPLADITTGVTGRTLDSAILGATLVALAGVVAILATRGVARRIVGGVVALSAVLLGWRAVLHAGAVSRARAIELASSKQGSIGIELDSHSHVAVHPEWMILTVLAAVLILAAGLLVAIFGGRWSSMSNRYEAPTSKPVAGDEAMWTALDRGDDPTIRSDT